jgi:Mrp family chromosome partitioning ATPase/capsular polysaccharide biosynthesis protein
MSEPVPLPGRGIKPLVSLRAHPRLALMAWVLVIMAGVPWAWMKGQPKYMSEAVIQVAPRYMKNLREDQEMEFQSNTQYRQFVQHTLRSITRQDVLKAALDSLKDKRSLWQKPDETERRAIDRLRENLIVAAVPDTYLVRIALEGSQKEGLAEVINAVTSNFLARMKAEDIYGADERTTNLLRRERELLAVIADKAEQRGVIARELSLTTFNEGTPNPYDNLVASLRGRVAESRQRRIEAEGSLAAFDAVADTNISVRSVSDAVLNDPGLNSLKAALLKRRADVLVSISGLKADHPTRLAADRELKEIDLELKQQAESLRGTINANLKSRLLGTIAQARHVEGLLGAELQDLESRATEFAGLFQRAMLLTTELTQARLDLEKVRDRLGYLNVEANSLGFLRMVSEALTPELPFGPGRKKLLLMVIMAAFGAALLLPIVRDLLDKRLFTVNDVERLMGIPPAGWQIERGDAATEIFAQEQLRRLASSLVRARDNSASHVFGFTGIKPAVGTTTLVLDLGRTLQALGFKVLLVEANGHARDSRYETGRPGLLEFLRSQAKSSEIIGGRTLEEPPRVAVGGRGVEPLPRLDRLKAVIQHWGGIADFVLVDMPALLSSADAELLARTVGNTLLVVQAGRTEKGELQRARRMLLRIDPASVGVVVNRIAPFQGGGYLKEQLVESVTGRSAGSFFKGFDWRLRWDTWRLNRRSR